MYKYSNSIASSVQCYAVGCYIINTNSTACVQCVMCEHRCVMHSTVQGQQWWAHSDNESSSSVIGQTVQRSKVAKHTAQLYKTEERTPLRDVTAPPPTYTYTLYYYIGGVQSGLRIGLQEPPHCRASASNPPSAREHTGIVDQYIQAQVGKGCMAGTFPNSEWLQVVLQSYWRRQQHSTFSTVVDMFRATRVTTSCSELPSTNVQKFPYSSTLFSHYSLMKAIARSLKCRTLL